MAPSVRTRPSPAVLASPNLRFFRDYLEGLGAKLPAEAYGSEPESDAGGAAQEPRHHEHAREESAVPVVEEEQEEKDEGLPPEPELDMESVVEPDEEPSQKMGDPDIEVTDEMMDKAQLAKAEATEALASGDYEKALEGFTEAILNNPSSAIPYASRASLFVRMKKPNAAIADCDAALQLNPDSAKAHKWRGEAKALLGQWEEAAKDLRFACQIDYDEEAAATLKRIEPNVHKLEEYQRQVARQQKAREDRERQQRRAEAQAMTQPSLPSLWYHPWARYDAASKRDAGTPSGSRSAPRGPGGMPGGMPPGMDKVFNDPEMMAAFSDPEVMAALQDVMSNPANIAKHAGNPKVGPILTKLMTKFGGGAGMASGMGGGMGGGVGAV
eukprot:SM000014S00411  [mRNA]  locus=s14:1240993:1244396:+ [translate_table: standard]